MNPHQQQSWLRQNKYQMSRPQKIIYTPKIAIFIAVTFIFTVMLNYLYEQSLYLLGIDLIKHMQNHRNQFLDAFFLLVTMLIDPSIVIISIIALLLVSKNKKKAFLMTLFVVFNTYCAAVLKAYHIDPRPIWTHFSIKNIGYYCPVQYGNPSGHSWFSAILGFGFILEYFGNGKNNRNFLVAIFLCILVPLSRMYLGAHSLDQVLYGLAMGLQICIFFSLQLKHSIEEFLFNFTKTWSWKMLIIILHVISIIPFMINYTNQLPQKWIDNIFLKCKKQMNESTLNFLMLVVNCMLINVSTGIGMAYHHLAADRHGRYYLSGNWRMNREKYGRYFGYILYMIIQILSLGSGMAIGILFLNMTSNRIFWYWGLGLSAVISGYIYTRYTLDWLLKLQLIQEGRRKAFHKGENKESKDKEKSKQKKEQ